MVTWKTIQEGGLEAVAGGSIGARVGAEQKTTPEVKFLKGKGGGSEVHVQTHTYTDAHTPSRRQKKKKGKKEDI